VLGKRDDAFLELKKLLEPFQIKHFYTDNWRAYSRNLPTDNHTIGKENT
jgi:insertion element IS1 protein InsB